MLGEQANMAAVALSAGEALIVTSDAVLTALKSSPHMPHAIAEALAADDNVWRIHKAASAVEGNSSAVSISREASGSSGAQALVAARPTQAEIADKICDKYGIARMEEGAVREQGLLLDAQQVRNRSLQRRGSYQLKVDFA